MILITNMHAYCLQASTLNSSYLVPSRPRLVAPDLSKRNYTLAHTPWYPPTMIDLQCKVKGVFLKASLYFYCRCVGFSQGKRRQRPRARSSSYLMQTLSAWLILLGRWRCESISWFHGVSKAWGAWHFSPSSWDVSLTIPFKLSCVWTATIATCLFGVLCCLLLQCKSSALVCDF